MLEQEKNSLKDKSFWIEHLKKAQVFNGSDVDYCRQNNLKSSTFSGHKKKHGFTKKPKLKLKDQAFKKVNIVNPKPHALKSNSPEWIAKFLKEFLR